MPCRAAAGQASNTVIFNHHSRKKNVFRSSAVNAVCQILRLLAGMVYRVIFLRILTLEYLGINGLFTNILGVLSLTELGITEAILYRLFAPISAEDPQQVGRLMRFFRNVYRKIALAIMIMGGITACFLRFLVRDAGEVPADVNLHIVFLLFLVQSASSYLFAYRFALLSADQKQYIETIIQTAITLLRYILQIVCLVITHRYIDTLMVGMAGGILLSAVASRWVVRQYPAVFSVQTDITKEERRAIYKDTSAAAIHKVGTVVLNSTDQILMSKYIGLAVTGIYSNYAMIITNASGMIASLFGGVTASFGNALSTMAPEDRYQAFKRMLFLNFWIVGGITACLYILMDDFIILWLRKSLLLDPLTLKLLCVMFFMQQTRIVPGAYMTATGLFIRDRARPVIEAALNLGISILALHWLGVAGIFVGTIVSCLLTVFWRVPWLLYHHAFQKPVKEYWALYIEYALLTFAAVFLTSRIKAALPFAGPSLLAWILNGCICVFVYACLHSLLFCRSKELWYFIALAKARIKRILQRKR